MKALKKLFSNIFNIAAVLGFVLTFATLIGIFIASYKFVDTMAEKGKSVAAAAGKKSEAATDDETSRVLLALSQKLASLNLVDPIKRDLSKAQVPPLCNIICNQSRFDFRAAEGEARENPVIYLRDFYNQEGPRAFSDPKFRLALETTMVYTDFFSPSSRKAILELGQAADHAGEMSESEKVLLSAKLPVMVLKMGTQFATRIGDLQDRANRASELNSLRQSCSRSNPKDVARECESL